MCAMHAIRTIRFVPLAIAWLQATDPRCFACWVSMETSTTRARTGHARAAGGSARGRRPRGGGSRGGNRGRGGWHAAPPAATAAPRAARWQRAWGRDDGARRGPHPHHQHQRRAGVSPRPRWRRRRGARARSAGAARARRWYHTTEAMPARSLQHLLSSPLQRKIDAYVAADARQKVCVVEDKPHGGITAAL